MAIVTIFAGTDGDTHGARKNMFARLWRAYRIWCLKRRTRRDLLDMTEEQLCDIGISRREARQEISKSFYWD